MKKNYLILLLLLLLLIYYISTLFRINKNTFYEGNEIKSADQYGFSTNGKRVRQNADKLMEIPYAMTLDSSKILVNSSLGDYGLVEIGSNCSCGDERVPVSTYWDGRSSGDQTVGLALEPVKYISNISFGELDISSANIPSENCTKVINVECRTDGVISNKDGYLLDTEIENLRANGLEIETERCSASQTTQYQSPVDIETPPVITNIIPNDIPLSITESNPINFDSDSGNPLGFLTTILSNLS